jgi:hypothetical protein
MALKGTTMGKIHLALGTHVWLLSRVDAEVLGQVAARDERLVATGTRVGLLSRMDAEVVLKVTAVCKRLEASSTWERLLFGVHTHVFRPQHYIQLIQIKSIVLD